MQILNIEKVAKTFLAALLLVAPISAIAEDAAATTSTESLSTSQTEVQTPSEVKSKVLGVLDLRAEYYSFTGAKDTSNYGELGYQFNPDVKVTWFQGFDSNIYNSSVAGAGNTEGLKLVPDQGWLRTRVNNIWQSNGYSFNYESRIYAPTWQKEREQGNITRLYNAFKLAKKFNDTFTLTLAEIVIPEAFKTAGTMPTPGGMNKGGANPYYENRVYLIADVNFTSKLSLDFPILAYQTRYRNYQDGATNNDSWQSFIYIWPELDYAINDHLTFGLAFVSDNLMTPKMDKFTIGDGLKNGTTQFVVTMSL